MRTAAIVVVLGLSTAMLGGTCSSGLPAPSLPVPGHQESIRIGTSNAQFLPDSDHDESRSARIAHRVLDSRLDGVVGVTISNVGAFVALLLAP